ncbi:helix-turn-helix domain-containing protein [Zavarzinia sp.]
MIGISRSSLYRLVDRGTLSPVKVGSRTLFRVVDLEALAATGEVRQ